MVRLRHLVSALSLAWVLTVPSAPAVASAPHEYGLDSGVAYATSFRADRASEYVCASLPLRSAWFVTDRTAIEVRASLVHLRISEAIATVERGPSMVLDGRDTTYQVRRVNEDRLDEALAPDFRLAVTRHVGAGTSDRTRFVAVGVVVDRHVLWEDGLAAVGLGVGTGIKRGLEGRYHWRFELCVDYYPVTYRDDDHLVVYAQAGLTRRSR